MLRVLAVVLLAGIAAGFGYFVYQDVQDRRERAEEADRRRLREAADQSAREEASDRQRLREAVDALAHEKDTLRKWGPPGWGGLEPSPDFARGHESMAAMYQKEIDRICDRRGWPRPKDDPGP